MLCNELRQLLSCGGRLIQIVIHLLTIATDRTAAAAAASVIDCISGHGIHQQVAAASNEEQQDVWCCCQLHPIYLRIISITAPIDLLSSSSLLLLLILHVASCTFEGTTHHGLCVCLLVYPPVRVARHRHSFIHWFTIPVWLIVVVLLTTITSFCYSVHPLTDAAAVKIEILPKCIQFVLCRAGDLYSPSLSLSLSGR